LEKKITIATYFTTLIVSKTISWIWMIPNTVFFFPFKKYKQGKQTNSIGKGQGLKDSRNEMLHKTK